MKEIYFFNENNGKSYSLQITPENFDRLMDMFSAVESDEQPLQDEDVFSLCESHEEMSDEDAEFIKKELDDYKDDICLN